MARALAFDAARSDLFKANAELLRHYGDNGAPQAALHLANALVLGQHGDAVVKAYRDPPTESFAAEIFGGDVARINQWIAQKTQGKIERGLDSLPQDDIAVLIDAIYFRAPWAEPFKPTSTYDGHFVVGYDYYLEDHRDRCQNDELTGDYATVGMPTYRAAWLPYKTPSLGMIVVLPDESSWVEAVLDELDIAELTRLRGELARTAPSHTTLKPAAIPRPVARVAQAGAGKGRRAARVRLDARGFQRHDARPPRKSRSRSAT